MRKHQKRRFDATFYCLDVVSFLEKCHKYEFIDAPSEELLSQLKEMVVVSNNDKNAITSPNNMVSSNSSNTMSTGEVNK